MLSQLVSKSLFVAPGWHVSSSFPSTQVISPVAPHAPVPHWVLEPA